MSFRQRPEVATCRFCGDSFVTWICDECKGRVLSACRECHNELCKGEVGPPLPSRAGRGGGRLDEGDDNATRAREDGR